MRLFKHFRMVAMFLVLANLLATSVLAKDLRSRLGIGFVDQYSNGVPALSAKYGLTKDLHIATALGFSTADRADVVFSGKIFKNIFFETNLNFYSALALAYLKHDERSGIEILGVLGAEFFIPGVDSLGLSFETGVSGSNITNTFVLKTIGFTFLHAGMHFYF
ncbi:MAG TPA: hypothetical protein PLH57_06915, partial [Oligoflexia bacterium]|nr:hypothetical protein [Oligoflexia bacterium]